MADDEAPIEEPFDLGVLEFSVDRWTYEQEAVLRMIRNVFEVPYSDHPKDRDEWRCWISTQRASRLGRLYCARMGDITARRPVEMLKTSSARAAGYGMFLESTDTVTRSRFEQIMKDLTGPEQFNDEFVARLMAGDRPPRYFPRDGEIDDYLAATEAIEALSPAAADEEIKRVVERTDLTVSRFEEIARMAKLFPSVASAIDERGRQDSRSRPNAPDPE